MWQRACRFDGRRDSPPNRSWGAVRHHYHKRSWHTPLSKEHAMNRVTLILLALAAAGSLTGCTQSKSEPDTTRQAAAKTATACEGDAGIAVPAGFCASIFADNLGHARHLAVAPNGDVYVNTWSSMYTMMKNAPGGYIVALRD